MVYKNTELIEQLFKKQKNIVLMGGHYGNWELLAITINHVLPHQCMALYTPLRDSFWDEKNETQQKSIWSSYGEHKKDPI